MNSWRCPKCGVRVEARTSIPKGVGHRCEKNDHKWTFFQIEEAEANPGS